MVAIVPAFCLLVIIAVVMPVRDYCACPSLCACLFVCLIACLTCLCVSGDGDGEMEVADAAVEEGDEEDEDGVRSDKCCW